MAAIVLASTENMSYEDWLENRRQGIGGSDASVVCGINRYKSPLELWMEKTAFRKEQFWVERFIGDLCSHLLRVLTTGGSPFRFHMPTVWYFSEPQ